MSIKAKKEKERLRMPQLYIPPPPPVAEKENPMPPPPPTKKKLQENIAPTAKKPQPKKVVAFGESTNTV